MIDRDLLRIMKHRKDFNMLFHLVQTNPTLDKRTKILIQDFKKYFDSFPEHEAIDLATLIPRFPGWHPALKDEEVNLYIGVFRQIVQDADEDVRNTIVNEIAELDMMTKLANLALAHSEGDLPQAYGEISKVIDEYRQRSGIKGTMHIETPIAQILQQEFDNSGVQWRLASLIRSMRPLRGGDFGIIAGRPDKGKTSFLADQLTFMAGQLPPDRNVVWLNNEGPGDRIIPRLYQAGLNMTMIELKDAVVKGTAEDDYRKLMGGRLDRIRIFDIHGYTNTQVEMLIETNSPGIVVYDMIDNIRGFGGEARTDLALEEMYKWARERAVKYDCIGLATSQISADGDGVQFPTLGMLKDSKTGKQGACDFQLMIGASNDQLLAGSRFLGLPKNKLRRPDGPADPRAEVIFDGIRSRYMDPPLA